MPTIRELRKRANTLTQAKIRKDLINFINIIKEEFIAHNVATLHEDSQDVDGKPIGFYSRATEIITNGRKKAKEPYDLLESGKFLNSIFVKVQSNSIFFGNNDRKKKKVLKHLWSENIFGLQNDDLNKIIDTKLIPFFIDYYKTKLLR